jgi:hypothetical protein
MKTNSLSILAIMLLCSSTLFAITNFVSAQTILPGVSNGETFDYDYILTWTSADPSATPPTEYVELNNTQQMQFRIIGVSGSNVTYDFIKHFRNATQTVEARTINIEAGAVSIPYSFVIVGANLTKGQRIYPSGGYQTITDTVTRSYPSGDRETNVLSGENSEQKTTIYYDKIKGITVEYSFTIYETINGYSVNSTERLVNTNSDVWTVIPELSTLIVPLALFVATAALLVAKTAKKRHTH